MLKQMRNAVKTFHNDERGASAIEYAVMAGLLVVILVAAIGLLGGGEGDSATGINKSFSDISDKMQVE